MIDEETREAVDRHVIEHVKPKVLEKKVPAHPKVAAKVYACLNNPPGLKQLPSDFDRTLIKAQQQRKK